MESVSHLQSGVSTEIAARFTVDVHTVMFPRSLPLLPRHVRGNGNRGVKVRGSACFLLFTQKYLHLPFLGQHCHMCTLWVTGKFTHNRWGWCPCKRRHNCKTPATSNRRWCKNATLAWAINKCSFKLQYVTFITLSFFVEIAKFILMCRGAVKRSCDTDSLSSWVAVQTFSFLKVSDKTHPSNQSEKAN